MKIGVILYHSNINKIYKKRWIDECINSILNQTIKDFIFYEINYSGDNYSVIPESAKNKKQFYSLVLKNYAEAMNFILDKALDENCDVVFNINLDDIYHAERFEKQIKEIKNGYDLVSTDFCYIREINDNEDEIFYYKNICQHGDINFNLKNNHNVIAHPSVCYSKKFLQNNRYNIALIPCEDLDLWKRSCDEYKFHIVNEVLLNYRIHENQVSYSK
jgi:hypothetical protein